MNNKQLLSQSMIQKKKKIIKKKQNNKLNKKKKMYNNLTESMSKSPHKTKFSKNHLKLSLNRKT